MTVTIYNTGLDLMNDFTSGDYRVLLLQGGGYTPDPDDVYVADLTPGTNEVAGAGYSRVTLAGKARTPDNANDWVYYDCNDPNFGSIAIGESVDGMVLYKHVTNDADSLLVAHFSLTSDTTGSTFVVLISPNGILRKRQGTL